MAAIFKVTLNKNLIGFFSESDWATAAREGAKKHKSESGEVVDWVQFDAKCIIPKHYQVEGVPEELYSQEEPA